MKKHLDEIFLISGCGLLLYGTWLVLPIAIWFVAGVMCIIAGILIGVGQVGGKRQ